MKTQSIRVRITEFSVADEAHIACANELGRKLAHELYLNCPCIVITHEEER